MLTRPQQRLRRRGGLPRARKPCLFCQTGLRLSGHCGAGWRWTAGALRWGGGAGSVAVPRSGAGRWGAGRAAQAESIPLPRTMGRACLLPRAMDGCLPAPASRSLAAGGRVVCRLVRRAVASPSFGSDEAGWASRSGQAGCCRCGSGRHAGKPWGVRLQGGWRPALWLGGVRMRAGWGGGSPSRAGLCAGGRTKQPLCVRWPSGTGLLAGGCGQSTFVLEAAWRGGVQPSVRM